MEEVTLDCDNGQVSQKLVQSSTSLSIMKDEGESKTKNDADH